MLPRAWYGCRLMGLGLLAGCLLWSSPLRAKAPDEQSLAVLQVGTETYRNVTVTTKAPDYIFIVHSGGLASIKVARLSPEVLVQLGYAAPPPPKNYSSNTVAWAKQTLAKAESPKLKQVEEKWATRWHETAEGKRLHLPPLTAKLILLLSAGFLLAHLLFSYCCQLICEKANHKPGVWAWVPIAQLLPLLRAAGLSAWWFPALFVPLLNLVAHVLWSVKIVKARGGHLWLTILLLLPVINVFAFLYLAFSGGTPSPKEDKRIEIMTLDAA